MPGVQMLACAIAARNYAKGVDRWQHFADGGNARTTSAKMNVAVSVRYKTQIKSAGGIILKESPWRKNLVLDQGLNNFAKKTNGNNTPVTCMTTCAVGSGTNPNQIASGAITFTQAGTTLTASGNFFTSGMVGGIFKYGASGSGGIEVYIVSFMSTTQVTVNTSLTVSTPTAGTVWQVQQTALQTQILSTSTYQTLSGNCGSTVASPNITHQRTFVFPMQGSPYNVNEIGWNGAFGGICGRAVLSSTDSVGINQIYVVVLAVTFTYSPGTPTAVTNVGTNINTAGNAMVEWFDCEKVNSDGSSSGGSTLDNQAHLAVFTVTYSQSGTIQSNFPFTISNTNMVDVGNTQWTYLGGSVGIMRLTQTNVFTTTGQNSFGVGIGRFSSPTVFLPSFDIFFTTPQALPNGAFNPSITFQTTYGRTLIN